MPPEALPRSDCCTEFVTLAGSEPLLAEAAYELIQWLRHLVQPRH